METKIGESLVLPNMKGKTVPESVTMVLENDLLLEKILIHAQHPHLSLEAAQLIGNIRLVSKLWLFTMSRLLRGLEWPVYMFNLENENHVTKLRKFVDARKYPSIFTEQESLLTYSLNLTTEFLESGDHQLLRECLVECGYSLKSITVEPVSMSSFLNCYIPKLHLPLLHRIDLVADRPNSNRDIFEADGISLALLCQSIISCATQLKTCVFRTKCTKAALPVDVLTLLAVLPKTISILRLGGMFYGQNLQKCWEMMDLSNLRILALQINTDEQRIPTLKNLRTLKIYNYTDENVSVTFSGTFESLRHLWILKVSLKEKCSTNVLTTYFPNLTSLEFCATAESQVTTWSPSTKVDTLSVGMLKCENESGLARDRVSLYAMQWLHRTYRNVRYLKILCIGEASVLTYIFQNMRQLQSLTIKWDEDDFKENEIESAICGTTAGYVSVLRQDGPKYWGLPPNENGIYLLTELTELKLMSIRSSGGVPPSLSGLTFLMAFMQMPKLKNLTLIRCYEPSIEIEEYWNAAENWKKQVSGRKLNIVN